MSEKKSESVDFSTLFKDAKPVKHDKYIPGKDIAAQQKQRNTKLADAKQRLHKHNKDTAQQHASVALSDQFEAHWPANKPIKYIRQDLTERQGETQFLLHKDMLKKLSMAQVPPDIELDLHGATAKNAKLEIIAAIFEAKRHQWPCINIIHGHGGGILKKKVPNWLVQHPDVVGFVQAPRAYGGQAGLLVLISIDFQAFGFTP